MSSNYISKAIKEALIDEASGHCEYCLISKDYSTKPFEFDHIIPLFLGGNSELSNLVFTCGGCNLYKHAKIEGIDPFAGYAVPLYNPRKEIWANHFEWSKDFTLIIGLTATGRATIDTLKMNRKELINLRNVLFLFGDHPPVLK